MGSAFDEEACAVLRNTKRRQGSECEAALVEVISWTTLVRIHKRYAVRAMPFLAATLDCQVTKVTLLQKRRARSSGNGLVH